MSGYIAPHMAAIKDGNNDLIAALDPNDSVNIDSYFPNHHFLLNLKDVIDIYTRKEEKASKYYVSICSPNYLHDSQIRFALHLDLTY